MWQSIQPISTVGPCLFHKYLLVVFKLKFQVHYTCSIHWEVRYKHDPEWLCSNFAFWCMLGVWFWNRLKKLKVHCTCINEKRIIKWSHVRSTYKILIMFYLKFLSKFSIFYSVSLCTNLKIYMSTAILQRSLFGYECCNNFYHQTILL